jgi:hypothetical protein
MKSSSSSSSSCASTVLVRTFSASHGKILNLFRQLAGLFERVISPSKGLYIHRKTRTNINTVSWIRTHDLSESDRAATGTDRANEGLAYLNNLSLTEIEVVNMFSFKQAV